MRRAKFSLASREFWDSRASDRRPNVVGYNCAPLRGRLMVGRLTLDQVVKVRVLAPQPPRAAAWAAFSFRGSRSMLGVGTKVRTTHSVSPPSEAISRGSARTRCVRARAPEHDVLRPSSLPTRVAGEETPIVLLMRAARSRSRVSPIGHLFSVYSSRS